jgi:hypothetical protein
LREWICDTLGPGHEGAHDSRAYVRWLSRLIRS